MTLEDDNGPVTEDVLDQANANMTATWSAVLAAAPASRRVDDGELVLLSSGLRVNLFNPAFLWRRPPDPTAAVARVVEHYGGLDLPFVLYFRDERAPGVADACVAAGLVEHFRPPVMVLDPIPEAPPPPPGVEIVPMDEGNASDHARVLATAFGMPEGIAQGLFGPTLLQVEGFRSFLALVDGEPVATAGSYVAPEVPQVGGVYNVATVPEARGRGIGAAVTWAAVGAGARGGAVRSILQASEQGLPVYERMGFATPLRYRQFVPA